MLARQLADVDTELLFFSQGYGIVTGIGLFRLSALLYLGQGRGLADGFVGLGCLMVAT